MYLPRVASLAAAVALAAPAAAHSQSGQQPTRHVLSIGDYPNVAGLRLNFRDRHLGEVRGAKVTIWTPYGDPTGSVHGLAVGLPATGAATVRGVAVGVVGVTVGDRLQGIGFAPIGIGAGNRITGIAIGGIGVGSGGSIDGIALGGIGAGVGGNAHGVMVGGIGGGIGGSFSGIAAGGIGVGAGGSARGLLVGGIGAGVGGSLHGVGIGGIGLGVGADLRGVALAGVGVGAGSRIDGIAIAGVGIGSPVIRTFAMAPVIGTKHVEGLTIAPVMLRVARGGSYRGVSVAGINDMRGRQTGLAIGLFNYAYDLNGLQVGVINVARNATVKVMPIMNYHRD